MSVTSGLLSTAATVNLPALPSAQVSPKLAQAAIRADCIALTAVLSVLIASSAARACSAVYFSTPSFTPISPSDTSSGQVVSSSFADSSPA